MIGSASAQWPAIRSSTFKEQSPQWGAPFVLPDHAFSPDSWGLPGAPASVIQPTDGATKIRAYQMP